MFGYVRPMKAELKVREHEEYKAVYCTLCRELSRHYGRLAKFALSFDITFYAVLALGVNGAKPAVRKGRCVVNPAKKCTYICEGREEYHKAAALTVLMTYQKLADNMEDEKTFKRLGSAFLRLFVKGPAKKAKSDFPFMAEAIENMMAEQKKAESDEHISIDACCAPTANALSAIFSELAGGDEIKKRVLSQLGYFLGRWIYAMDAADDLEKDMKDGAFNPFISRLGLEGKTEVPPEEKDRVENYCNEVLNSNVAMILSAVNLLDTGRYENIIRNVTELGFPEVQREIIFLHVHSKDRKKTDNLPSPEDKENSQEHDYE